LNCVGTDFVSKSHDFRWACQRAFSAIELQSGARPLAKRHEKPPFAPPPGKETMSDPSAKIIVDDDWKSQVEKEKEVTTTGDKSSDSEEDISAITPPDASFETLVTMLFTQGMAALGQLPGGDNQPMPINKGFAKHFIDTIEILGTKTKGNLSEDESTMLGEVLHVLRMTFVSVKAPK
jgi:hypothetical protein